jgi:transposase-like protein
MTRRSISIEEGRIPVHLDRVVRDAVEQTLNKLLEAEAGQLCGANRYERTADRVDTQTGSYEATSPRKIKTGKVTLERTLGRRVLRPPLGRRVKSRAFAARRADG